MTGVSEAEEFHSSSSPAVDSRFWISCVVALIEFVQSCPLDWESLTYGLHSASLSGHFSSGLHVARFGRRLLAYVLRIVEGWDTGQSGFLEIADPGPIDSPLAAHISVDFAT